MKTHDFIYFLLLARNRELSDGAKVTALELIPHFTDGRLPSTSELSSLRELDVDTIKAHMDELVRANVLVRVPTNGTKRSFSFNEDALAVGLGFTKIGDVDLEKLKMDGVSKPPQAKKKPYLKPARQMTPKDLLGFFYSLYAKEMGSTYVGEKRDYNRIKSMIRRFSPFIVYQGIRSFIVDRNILDVEEVSIKEMFQKHQGLLHGLDDHYEPRSYPCE